MKHQGMSRLNFLALSAFAVSAAIAGLGSSRMEPTRLIAADPAPTKVEIKALSTDPGRGTGGNVLVQIALPAGTPAESVRVTLDGRDVGSVFQSVSPNARVGLVTGLVNGKNTLHGQCGQPRARVARDHELSDHRPGDVRAVAAAVHLPDRSVHAAGRQRSSARRSTPTAPRGPSCSTSIARPGRPPEFKPLPGLDDACRPMSRRRRRSAGATVNFIVRVETGTMNRGIYQNAILHDPTVDPPPAPLAPPKGWNRRLVALHGSGCPSGWYIQGAAMGAGGVLDAARLGRGLRDLHQHAQPPDQQLQCGRRRRDGDDGQGTLHRNVRRAVLHDQRRRIGRRVHEPADRRRVARASSTASTSAPRSPTPVDRAVGARRASPDPLLRSDQSIRLHGRAESRRQRLRGHEGVHRRREPVAADRSGAEPRRHGGLSVGAVERGGSGSASLRSGQESQGRAADGLRRGAKCLRQESRNRRRAPSVRQRRRPVRAERAQQRRDHHEAVPRSQREDRRLRSGCQLRAGAHQRRRRRDQARVSGRLDARRQRRADVDSDLRQRHVERRRAATTTAGSTSRCARDSGTPPAASPTTW